MTFDVLFSDRAERQLEALYDYIELRSGSERAESFTADIVAYCKALLTFPERGTRRDDLRPGLRVLGYRRRVSIAFVVGAGAVVILGVYYGGRNYDSDLGGPT